MLRIFCYYLHSDSGSGCEVLNNIAKYKERIMHEGRGSNFGCNGEHFFDASGFSDVFARLFGGSDEILASTTRRLASMSKKDRNAEIAKMPEHMRRALVIETKMARKQSGHILSEAKIRGRDVEIEQLGEVVKAFTHEVAALEKKISIQEKVFAKVSRKLKKQKNKYHEMKESISQVSHLESELAVKTEVIAKLEDHIQGLTGKISAKDRVLSQQGTELKDLRAKVQKLEEIETIYQGLCTLIGAIDPSANKPMLVEQLILLKDMAESANASVEESK